MSEPYFGHGHEGEHKRADNQNVCGECSQCWYGLGPCPMCAEIRRDLAKAKATLRKRVALMRELGVTSWDGVVLGPEPVKPEAPKEQTPEEVKAELKRAEEAQLKRTYGATGIRPRGVE